jgi:alpha-L-rhamnosidase
LKKTKNKLKRTWLPVIFILLLSSAGRSGSDFPYGLIVEFIREAAQIRIPDPNPEFSWIVPDRAGFQTAFQILVASKENTIADDEGDVWDSGKTISSLSTEVEYSGRGLSENSEYFWKVRIWNKKGKASPWSEVWSFKTGIFDGYQSTGNKFIENLIRPEKFIKTGENSFFADFGKDAFGTLVFEINPTARDTITIHLGEKSNGINQVDRDPGGTIRYQKILLPVEPGKTSYTLNPVHDERNTGPAAIQLPDSFGIITPFRYCEIENCRPELKPENIFQKAYWYYFNDEMSAFECSDTVLNKVWDLCKYSIKATSFAGIYIDGDRERIPYEADAYINQLGHYCTDREYSLARRTNEYFMTHPTWPTEWILQTVPLFYNDLMFTGNYESVTRYYAALQHKTLVSLARPDGLISSKDVTDEIMSSLGFSNAKDRIRDIIDWPPSQKDTGWKLATAEGERDGYDLVEVNTVVNAFHYNNLVLMARIAGYLGKAVDSVLYGNRAEKVKTSFNKIFLDSKSGYYVDGEFSEHSSLHANMMALVFDLVPEENKGTVLGFIKSRGMACSVYGAQYLLEGLYRAGEGGYALDLMTATHDRSWWNMIRAGSTITLEAWDLKYKPNSDWNHAWGAAPANIIPGYMWGIVPVSPGFARAKIRPQMGDLTYSKISMPTIRGSIKAEFRMNGSSKEYIIFIPANMECDFIIDTVNNLTIKHNGKEKRIKSGNLILKPGLNKIILKQK